MAVSLKKLETKMESNQKAAWYENSLIMLKIRNEGLHKKKYGTFEKYLDDRWGLGRTRGHQLMKSAEFMQIAAKNWSENVHKKGKIVNISNPILPKNEGQIRPLIEKLEHNGQRIKVWAQVVETGEKINAELVQTKVDEFLASGEVVPDIEYIETEISLDKHHRAKGTGENEWYTPVGYIMAVKNVLGKIDLDPASSSMAQETIKADNYFTIDDDGLTKDWNGKVWMNPPYSQPAIKNFIEKLVNEYSSGNVTEAIVLTHNYTDTAWFHFAAGECSSICFTRGRIAFINPEGEKAAPTQGQAFFYYGENVERFKECFKDFGIILSR